MLINKNELVSVTLFSFEKGEEISTHAAGGDAMVTVLEGSSFFRSNNRWFLSISVSETTAHQDVVVTYKNIT